MKKKTSALTLTLLDEWTKAKAAEEAAKFQRLDLEAKLSLRPEIEIKEVGSKTMTIDSFKVETRGSINFSLDKEIWEEVKKSFDDDITPVIPKLEVNESRAKKLKEAYPQLWLIASKAITSKPGNPGFKIQKIGGIS